MDTNASVNLVLMGFFAKIVIFHLIFLNKLIHFKNVQDDSCWDIPCEGCQQSKINMFDYECTCSKFTSDSCRSEKPRKLYEYNFYKHLAKYQTITVGLTELWGVDKRGWGTCRAQWCVGTCRHVNWKIEKIYYTEGWNLLSDNSMVRAHIYERSMFMVC